MLNNLIRHSLRSFKRQRTYFIINVIGLSIGIACSLLIALYIFYEATYDRYNVKKDRIYNIVLNFRMSGEESDQAATSSLMGPEVFREFPEVENFLRMKKKHGANTLTYNNQVYSVENIIEADSSFFNFFTIPVLRGDPENLLNAPGKIVLSASVAKMIFGKQNPVDKILKIGKDTSAYVVTGVMKDIPGNSHFMAGVLVSMLSDPMSYSQHWGNHHLNTYLLLKSNTDPVAVDEKLKSLVVRHIGPILEQVLSMSFKEFLARGNKHGYYLQNLKDIHLSTSVKPHFLPAGDPKLLKILAGIALLILLVAAVNFTNLSTAQGAARAKEVGIKKLAGSTRSMLIAQFLAESVIMSFASTLIALIIIRIILPFFNDLLGTTITIQLSSIVYIIPSIIVFSLITGILAGTYPAFFLSSFTPYRIFKGGKDTVTHKGRLRKVLVVLQFTISIFLITGTLIMYRQLTYMLNRNPGFNDAHMLVLENAGALGDNISPFKEAISVMPGVIDVTSSSSVPGNIHSYMGYALEGKKDETILMWTNYVDYNFLQTYGMTLQSGRSFSKEYLSDAQTCLVNEAAVKKFNIDPVKMRIMEYRDSGRMVYYRIIGIVKDFIFESQKNEIAPFIFRLRPEDESDGYITVKILPRSYMEIISKIGASWKEFTANEPLKHTFIDDRMEQLYIKEKQNILIAVISSILAILIAALGLYGLNSFTIDNRTKEIGVRKAMGSSIRGICLLIFRETIILVSISALLSFPGIYFLSEKWLENFYYRIDPGILTFAGGLVIALLTALLTISYRTVKTAMANPAQSLRYE